MYMNICIKIYMAYKFHLNYEKPTISNKTTFSTDCKTMARKTGERALDYSKTWIYQWILRPNYKVIFLKANSLI